MSDCQYLFRNFYAKIPLSATANTDILDDQEYQLALFLISGLLEHVSTPERINNLLSFGLLIPTINFNKQHEPNCLLREEQSYDISPKSAQSKWDKLNIEQLPVAQKIINAIEE